MAIPSLTSLNETIAVLLVADAGAGGDGNHFTILVLIDSLGCGDQHLAKAALRLFEFGRVGGGRQHIAGADVVEVLNFGAAVEDALERAAGLRAGVEHPAAALRSRRVE